MGANKKRKAAATVGAVTLVAALVLTGTYAWNSISQKAKNENTVYANPGGRLHDDWNGSDPKNGIKRVYVENFTGKDKDGNDDPNAAPIYVRVKLQTYMEFGEEAGKVDAQGVPVSGRNAKPLIAGSDMGDTDTWPVYIEGQSSAFQSYFELKTELNKELDYMPTFNKNKESLMADINGTYAGKNAEDNVHFDDYVDYSQSTTKTAKEYWYKKDAANKKNPTDSGFVPGMDADYEEVGDGTTTQSHTAVKTLQTEKIVTMDEWLDYSEADKVGNYWVYDTALESDGGGWAYWAAPLEPETATGPLLTDVKMKASLGENCYYAINVTGEFASAGDWGTEDGEDDKALGFYKNGITDNALTLLDTIAKTVGADWVNITATSEGATADTTKNTISVNPGATVNFAGEVTLMGEAVTNQEIEWALDGTPARAAATATLTKSGNGATLTIPSDMTAQTLKVTATLKANPNATVTYKVKVLGPDTVKITNTEDRVKPGETLTFTANVTKKGSGGTDEAYAGNKSVKWSINGWKDGTTKIDESTGKLTVSNNEPSGTTLTVTAKSVADETVVGEKEIRVTKSSLPLDTLKTIDQVKVTEDGVLEGTKEGPNNSILGNANNTQTIEIDGVSFFVIAKKDGKALLLTKQRYKETMFFDTAVDTTTDAADRNHWKDSTIRAYLNSEKETYVPIAANGEEDSSRTYTGATAGWLNGKTDLAKAAIQTELKILQEFDSDASVTENIDTTKDKIFFLSEADIFGSTGNTEEASVPASFYTVTKDEGATGVKLVAPNGTWVPENAEDTITSSKWFWLRSPRYSADRLAGVTGAGELGYSGYRIPDGGGVRPSCWIYL